MNKLEPKEHFHGSDLEKIEEIYGIPKENIISFSANVNPLKTFWSATVPPN